MRIEVDEEFMMEIVNALRGHSPHLRIIAEIDNLIEVSKSNKEEINKLRMQEIWIKCFFDGYFYKFNDMSVNVEIREINSNAKEDGFKGTTTLFPPLIEEDGSVELTPLLFTLLHKMQENPDGRFKCFLTGFSRQMHLNKNLLSTPMPEGILKMFGVKKKDAP